MLIENYCRTRTKKEGSIMGHKAKNGKCEFCDKTMKRVPAKKSQGIIKKITTKKDKTSTKRKRNV